MILCTAASVPDRCERTALSTAARLPEAIAASMSSWCRTTSVILPRLRPAGRCPKARWRPYSTKPEWRARRSRGERYWIVEGAALYGFSGCGSLETEVPLPFAAPTKLAFFDGGLAVTAKSEPGNGSRLAVTKGLAPPLHGPAIPFWRADPP